MTMLFPRRRRGLAIIVLNSGSNGNAVYVESLETGSAVLLDCGISRRQIEQRLKIHGRNPASLDAVFLTHEHADHVRGVETLQKLRRLPVCLTEGTLESMRHRFEIADPRIVHRAGSVTVGDITVSFHPKQHDAADPVFFHLEAGGVRFLYATDLGTGNERLTGLLPEADALLLESNYDTAMLWDGDYPPYLKERIDADHGHLSNTQAMQLLEQHAPSSLRLLIFGHLSENNNTPEIVQDEVTALLKRAPHLRPHVHIASRYDVSDVMTVERQ
jgi:phosphoribosyl 1,2-cyclic phosphodiesterase